METLDDKQLLQTIFASRLSKSIDPTCPKCLGPAAEVFKPTERTKIWYCTSCLKTVAPLVGTIFEQTQLPIQLWLQITRQVLESGPKIQAKEIALEYGISMPTSYRIIEKVQAWQTKNSIIKRRRKSKIRKYRTGLHIIQEMILKSMPPLFENKHLINTKKNK